MGNQTIREQIFDALFDYTEKWGSICTESDCATVRDEICLRIDQSQFTADEAEEFVNQEVERRIAERMPSENMQHSYAYSYCMQQGMPNGEPEPDMEIYEAFCDGVEWGCGCLTNPGADDSQKTEGGGE